MFNLETVLFYYPHIYLPDLSNVHRVKFKFRYDPNEDYLNRPEDYAGEFLKIVLIPDPERAMR